MLKRAVNTYSYTVPPGLLKCVQWTASESHRIVPQICTIQKPPVFYSKTETR